MKIQILLILLFMSMIPNAFGSGVVAETTRGTIVTLDFDSYGTEAVQQFGSAHLKIINKAGKLVFEEKFTREQGSNVTMKQLQNGVVEIHLTIRSAKSTVDLKFKGKNRIGNEIDGLIKVLKTRNRKLEPGSSLIVKTPVGRFSFRDVIGATYGDL